MTQRKIEDATPDLSYRGDGDRCDACRVLLVEGGVHPIDAYDNCPRFAGPEEYDDEDER